MVKLLLKGASPLINPTDSLLQLLVLCLPHFLAGVQLRECLGSVGMDSKSLEVPRGSYATAVRAGG